VVFAGWLFDRPELAAAVGLHDPTEPTDAQLVLAAYLKWGKDAFRRLRGGFATVVWDERDRSIYAVRDQLGLHPLFRAEAGGFHLLSPSMDALRADARVSADADRGALLGLLVSWMPFQDETPYRAIRRIPQGHVWELRRDRTLTFRYWDPAPRDGPVEWIRDEELVRFDELFERAVERCLGLGRAGIYLSGGLDSVSVAAVAADLSRQSEPWALSLVFPHPEANEEAVQRSVAQALKLPHVVVPLGRAVGPTGVLQAGIDAAAGWPAPVLSPWLSGYRHLNEAAAARGCRSILTGGGGDEWLTVSPYWSADLLRRMRIRELARFAATQRRSYNLRYRHVLRNVIWTFALRRLIVDAALETFPGQARAYRGRRRARRASAWIAKSPEIRALLEDRLQTPIPSSSNRSVYLREMRSALDHPVMDLEHEEFFESGRRSNLRLLMPFWDVDLLTFLYRVPPEALNAGGRSKGLVRGFLDRRFPDCGFRRQRKVLAKHYFDSVVLEEAPKVRQRLGRVRALADLGIVDGHAVDGKMDELLSSGNRLGIQRVWDILSLEAWAQSHL
jgi:asparagine synthase (glutamine-hydrolysing)